MSDSISEIIYYPQKYTNVIYKDSEHPALFETDIAPGQTYIYENKNESEFQFKAKDYATLNIQIKYKSGLVQKYKESSPKK